ncbi:MAG: transposase [Saprospiraceae bacterium]|nr:transposase [Saprospiraceae bacterium]
MGDYRSITGKGNKAGMISILHTWGQNLSLHPHIHCIIPGGFVDGETWKPSKTDGKFLFPVKAMSKVYQAKYVAILRASELVMRAIYLQRIIPKRMGSVC